MSLRIAYAVLAHEDPHQVVRLVRRVLVDDDDIVAVHYDANSPRAGFDELRAALSDLGDRIVWARRVKVDWGGWSIVQATFNALEAIRDSGLDVDYVQLLSASTYPIRPLEDYKAFLERSKGRDFIECVDLNLDTWVISGPEHERYRYRHYFSHRRKKPLQKLFKLNLELQRRLCRPRTLPRGLMPHLGSQWWTLTWPTCRAVLDLTNDRELISYFKTVFVPDEMFFQTVVPSISETVSMNRNTLTLCQFDDRGRPVLYYNGHDDYLARQPFFFARKISPQASRLHEELDRMVDGTVEVKHFEDDEFGIRTEEYAKHQARSSVLSSNTRLIGHVKDEWAGDLAQLHRRIIVVVGDSREELAMIQDLLNSAGPILCHGVLYDEHRIGFRENADSWVGYDADAIRIRTHNKENFLFDLANDAAPEQMAFLYLRESDLDIIERLFLLPVSYFLIVRGNVVRAFHEFHREGMLPAGAPSNVPDDDPGELAGMRDFVDELSQYYQSMLARCRDTRTPFCEIDLMRTDWLDKLNSLVRWTSATPDLEPIPRDDVVARAARMAAIPPPGERTLALLRDGLPGANHEALRAFPTGIETRGPADATEAAADGRHATITDPVTGREVKRVDWIRQVFQDEGGEYYGNHGAIAQKLGELQGNDVPYQTVFAATRDLGHIETPEGGEGTVTQLRKAT